MIAEVVITGSVVGYITYRRRRGKIRIENVVAGATAATQAAGAGDGIEFSPGQRISRDRECKHFFYLGETGSGKSNIVLRHQIEVIERRKARALILDPQGDLTERLKGSILAPWDRRSLRWDIASDVRTSAQAEAFADGVVPEPRGSENPMWANAARSILVAMFLKLITTKDQTWGWADLIVESGQDLETLQQTVRTYNPSASPIVEGASVTLAGIRTQLAAMFAALRSLATAWPDAGDNRQRFSLSRWILDPEHLPAHQRVILFQMSGEHKKLTEFLLQSVIKILLSLVASPRLPARDHDIWLYADEFLQAGKITDLRSLAEIARKKGVRVVFIAQSLTGLRATYGPDEGAAILDAVGTRVICRCSGQTAEWASKLFATKRVREMRLSQGESESSGGQSGGTSGSSTNYAEHVEELPVLRVDDFQSRMGIANNIITAAVHGFRQPVVLTWPYLAMPKFREPASPAAWTLPGYSAAPTPSAPPADAADPTTATGGGPALATDAPAPAAAAPALPPWAADNQAQSTDKPESEITNQDRDLSAVLSPEEDR